jgi:hypothetical protein
MELIGESEKLVAVDRFPLDEQCRKGIERIPMLLKKPTGLLECGVNQLTFFIVEPRCELRRAVHLTATDPTTEEDTSLALSEGRVTENIAHAPFGTHAMYYFGDPLEVVTRSVGEAIRPEYEVFSCAATKRDANLLEIIAP